MTVAETRNAFKVKLDKSNALAYPDFTDEEIDFWLTEAQRRFIKTRYSGNNPQYKSFEMNEKRTADLKEVIKEDTLSPLGSGGGFGSNAETYDLPSDYWFPILERLNIIYTDCNNATVAEQVEVKAIDHNKYSKYKKDPFNKPSKDRVLRIMQPGQAVVFVDSTTTAGTLYVRYIGSPLDFSDSQALSVGEHAHEEVVDLAVLLALENIESPRTQSTSALNIQNE